MTIKYQEYEIFYKDFYELIIELECGSHFDKKENQHEEWLRKRIKYLFEYGKAICLYSENDQPIGFIFIEYDKGLKNVRCFGKRATIKMFGLFPDQRSNHLGKQLLDECEKYLLSEGCECIYVDTYAKNTGAIRYYTKQGFIPTAYHPGDNGVEDKGQVYLYKYLK